MVLPERVTRILPAGPPASVLLEALAPDLMIGWPHPLSAAQKAMLPAPAAALPRVPMLTGHVDQTDAVPSMHPDLVLDYGTVSPRYVALDESIQRRTGVPTLLLDGSLAHVPQVLRTLGAALHREKRAEALAKAAEDVLSAVPRPPGKPTTVVLARGADGLDVAAAGNGATDVFATLGWTVLAPAGGGPVRHVSDVDAIARLDPDVVIFEEPGMRAVVAATPAWRALRAVRDRHAFIAPALPFGWFGEPPSINRLIGVAAFEERVTVPVLVGLLFGRVPRELPRLEPIPP